MYHVLTQKINSAHLPNRVADNLANQLIVKQQKSFHSFPNILNVRILDAAGNVLYIPFSNYNNCYDQVNHSQKITRVLIDPVYLERKEDALKNCVRQNDFYFFIDYDTINTKKIDYYFYSFSFIMPCILFFDKRNTLYQEAFKQDMFIDKITEMLNNIGGSVVGFSDHQTKDNLYMIIFNVVINISQKIKNNIEV
ncbi:MAG: hypothetical protein NZZ41_06875 [Candidatus Dojkabacteria bacterium]|nr:hypothetical protein [Candidatus Dojkabacteria bacterium]